MISKRALKSLSRRIRHGERRETDIKLIEEYRDSKLLQLFGLLIDINDYLSNQGIAFLIAGRPKRTKSIIRKLERGDVKDLASIVDVMGIRVIVDSISAQDAVISSLKKKYDVPDEKLKDYRLRGEGYRAVHLYVRWGDDHIETQVRTLPQQLWANESEALGERAKEGSGTSDQKAYLRDLTLSCKTIDDHPEVELEEIGGIGGIRGPIKGRLPRLRYCFHNAAGLRMVIAIFLVIYDRWTNELLLEFRYSMAEKSDALRDFCEKTRFLKEDRFDVLFLNAMSLDSLKVTHPIYFPIL